MNKPFSTDRAARRRAWLAGLDFEVGEVAVFELANLGYERHNVPPVRCLGICEVDGFLKFYKIIADANIFDELIWARTAERNRDELLIALNENIVAIDPAALTEINVVVNYILIDSIHYLKIAQVGKEIRLHDGYAFLVMDGERGHIRGNAWQIIATSSRVSPV